MPYELDGIEYPSVTTVLGILDKSGALTYWAAGCAVDYIMANLDRLVNPSGPHEAEGIFKNAKSAFTQKSETAKDTGTQVHDAIERYIRTGKSPGGEICDQAQNGFLAFLEWEGKNHIVWEQSEVTLYSKAYGFAGTADAVAVINGHRYLIDFKTAKGIYDEYRMQLAAYRLAWNESNFDKIENVAILRLDKETGEPEFKDVTKDIERKEAAFLKLLDFYYAEKKRRLKNNPRVAEVWG